MRSETPKVHEALALWCRYPNEIEADLKFRNVDIRDWHQGNADLRGRLILSSRLLLSLVHRLPEKSEFKTYAAAPFGRDGEWTELEMMVSKLHEETAMNRAAKYVGGPNEYTPTIFLSPLARIERKNESEEDEQSASELIDSLVGD